VVQEPIQDGAGQGAVVVEDFGPVFIGLVEKEKGSEMTNGIIASHIS